MTGLIYYPPATGWHRPGSGHWRPRSSGATSCCRSKNGGSSACCPSSPRRSRLRRPRLWRRQAPVGSAAAGGLLPARAAANGPGPPAPVRDVADGAHLRSQATCRDGEREKAERALAGYALRVAEDAAAGLQASTGEVAAALWLDAEDATVHQGLALTLGHDQAAGLRLAVALAPWWRLRGRYAAGTTWLRAAVGHATPGSDLWCAAYIWLGSVAVNTSDCAEALGYFTVVRDARADQPPTPALVDSLSGRSIVLVNTDRIPEGIEEARQSVTLARAIGYPAGEALGLADLSLGACYAGNLENALAIARQARQVDPAAIPGRIARWCTEVAAMVQMEACEANVARSSCTEGLSRARQAGDLAGQLLCCLTMARLDVLAGRLAQACVHLREALELGIRTGSRTDLAGLPRLLRSPVRGRPALDRRRHHMGRVRQSCPGRHASQVADGRAPSPGTTANRQAGDRTR